MKVHVGDRFIHRNGREYVVLEVAETHIHYQPVDSSSPIDYRICALGSFDKQVRRFVEGADR
jgi:hypothetical protein